MFFVYLHNEEKKFVVREEKPEGITSIPLMTLKAAEMLVVKCNREKREQEANGNIVIPKAPVIRKSKPEMVFM
jgi:hypothetical protein